MSYDFCGLGEQLKKYRNEAQISQLKLETHSDLPIGSLSKIENGLTNPTKETIIKIALGLDLSPYETARLFGIEL